MLLYFLICFVIATSAFPEGHFNSDNVTVAAEDGAGGRIAGGEDPDRGARAASFQAQITREGATFCSGTIMNDWYIVTAAHCVEGARPQELTVRIGRNIRGKGLVVPIEEIVLHPDYDYPQNNYDIAYMRTAVPISFNRTIGYAFIARPGSSVPKELHVTGWGYQEDNQKKLADKIRAVDLPVISNTECQVFYPMMSITKNMICGYSFKDQDKGTCVAIIYLRAKFHPDPRCDYVRIADPIVKFGVKGDGGDPATVRSRLVGVSSATTGCGPGMAPSVFTYVDAPKIRSFILIGISGRPQRPSKRPKESSKCSEKHPDERPEKAVKTPERDSENPEECPEKVPKTPAESSDHDEERPGDASKRPEKPPGEHHEKAPKNPGDASKRPEKPPGEHHEKAPKNPGDASKRPENPPGEHHEKAPKTPAEGSDHDEERPGDVSKHPEKPPGEHHDKAPKNLAEGSDHDEERPGDASERPEQPPGEHHEKAPKTAAEGSDYDEERPGDASERPGDASERPEQPPGEHHEKAPKTAAEGSDYDEERPGDASERPEQSPGEHHEKAPKTHAEGSDYDEERPGDASKSPEEDAPADRPEEL